MAVRLLKDPATINSRIFVGHLQTEDMNKHELEEHFQKYGNIVGSLINRGFGFVQFEDEQSAVKAIQNENGSLFKGRRIDVRPAKKDNQSGGGGGGGGGPAGGPGIGGGGGPINSIGGPEKSGNFPPSQGGMNNSFGGGGKQFGGPKDSFGSGNQPFGGANKSFGAGNNQNFGKDQFGGGNQNSFGGNQSRGPGNGHFGGNLGQGGPNDKFGGPNQNRGGPNPNRGGNNDQFAPENQNRGIGESFAGGNQNRGSGEPFAGGNQNRGSGEPFAGGNQNRGSGEPFAGGNQNRGSGEPFAGGNQNRGGSEPFAGGNQNRGSGEPFPSGNQNRGSGEPFAGGNQIRGGGEPFAAGNQNRTGAEPFAPGNQNRGGGEPFAPGNQNRGGGEPFAPGNQNRGSAEPFGVGNQNRGPGNQNRGPGNEFGSTSAGASVGGGGGGGNQNQNQNRVGGGGAGNQFAGGNQNIQGGNQNPGGRPRGNRGGKNRNKNRDNSGGAGGGSGGSSGGGGNNFRDRSPINRGNHIDDKGGRDWERGKLGDRGRGLGYGRDSFADIGGRGYDDFAGVPPNARDVSSGFGGLSGTNDYQPSVPAEKNDCEIIVVSKALTEYAEAIEMRLKKLGLTVDLLFPNEDVPLSRVLGNIASRGCLYAVVVTHINQEHRSLTLNILHGLPQEHRNMPVEDAIALINRDFTSYRAGSSRAVPVNVPLANDRHPDAVQVLLNMLADNRQLTVLQYDRVLKYLEVKREEQVQIELGDAKDLAAAIPVTSDPKQAELQSRILNILNSSKPAPVAGPVPSPVPAPVPVPPANWGAASATSVSTTGASSSAVTPSPLLNDPTVQKALDSLLQGNLLKSIGDQQPATSTPLFAAFPNIGRL